MNKVEDLSRQIGQQVIVEAEGTKWVQPRMDKAQTSMAVSNIYLLHTERAQSVWGGAVCVCVRMHAQGLISP